MQREVSMRKSIVVITAVATLAFVADGTWAASLTKQQVQNVCGSSMTTYKDGSTGCTKTCGKTLCDYNCKGDKCTGIAATMTTPGGSAGSPKGKTGLATPPSQGLLNDPDTGLSPQGPAPTGGSRGTPS